MKLLGSPSARLFPLLLAAGIAACEVDTEAPPFPEGQGQAPGGATAYPPGPYGVEKGSVIPNFELVGLADPSADMGEESPIQLADFYNPTGSDAFPEGSILGAGEPKPKLLLVNVSAVWCQPCQYEAEVVLPPHYEEFAPLGVQFLLVLADGPNQGVAATFNHLISWTSKYETSWPATIDPQYAIGSLFKGAAFPVNILVDTETMKIVEAAAGLPEDDSPLFVAIEDLTEE